MASKDDQIDYVATWPIIEEHFVKLLRRVAKYELFVEFGKRYTLSKLYDHLYVGMQMKMFRNNRASS